MVPPGVIYHGGQDVESGRSDWQACAASACAALTCDRKRTPLRPEVVRRLWLARTTFFGGVSRRRFVWRLSIGWGAHLLAGKLRPGSIRGLLIGMTRR